MTALAEYWQQQQGQPATWQPGNLTYDVWADAFSWQLTMRFVTKTRNDMDWRIPLLDAGQQEDYSDLLLLAHSLFRLMSGCPYPYRCLMELSVEPNPFLPQLEQLWPATVSLLAAGWSLYGEKTSVRDLAYHADRDFYSGVSAVTSLSELYGWVQGLFFFHHLLRRQVELWRQRTTISASGWETERLVREVYSQVQQQYPLSPPLPPWLQLLLMQDRANRSPERASWLLSPVPGVWFRLPLTFTLREVSTLLRQLVVWCRRKSTVSPGYYDLQSVSDWQEDDFWDPAAGQQFLPESDFTCDTMQVKLSGPWVNPSRMKTLVTRLKSGKHSGQLQLHADPQVFWTPSPRKIRKGPAVLTCPWPVAWNVTMLGGLHTLVETTFRRQLHRALRSLQRKSA